MNNLKQKSLSGISWTLLRLFTVQLSGFIVQLILARILLPEIFGLIAMMQLFISLGQTLLDSGMTSSLIRSKDVDDNDYSTVFYLNIIFSVLVYLVIFSISGLISKFYHQEVLSSILKIYSISIIIQGLIAVQLARITKEMKFKLQLQLEVPSIIISSILGIWMAYNDYGVWSIVNMYLIKNSLFAIQVWYFSKWLPRLTFDLIKLKKHFNFGYKLTLSSIINTIYDNIYTIIIGRNFSALQLGFYDRANTLRLVPIQTISTALNNVTYPMFSSIQNNDVELRNTYKKVMQLVIFVVAPLMFLAILNAEYLFRVLLTDKWLPSVYYFKILCAASILYPIHAYNLNILNVKGRSDLFLRLELIKKIIITICLFMILPFGILGLIYMQLVLNILMFLINTFYSGKLIKYNSWQQAKDILPYIIISIVGYLITLTFNNLFFLKVLSNDLLLITFNTLLFSFVYASISFILKLSAITDVIKLIFRNYDKCNRNFSA